MYTWHLEKRKIKPTDVAPKGISPPLAKQSIQSAPAPASVKEAPAANKGVRKDYDDWNYVKKAVTQRKPKEKTSPRKSKNRETGDFYSAIKKSAQPGMFTNTGGTFRKPLSKVRPPEQTVTSAPPKAPESTAKKDSRLDFAEYNKAGSKLGMKLDDILRGAFSFLGTLPKSTDEDKWKNKRKQ